MMLYAIDPGTTYSAIVGIRDGKVVAASKQLNLEVLDILLRNPLGADHIAVEMVACYGLPVGAEVFETVLWIGRYIQAWGKPHTQVFRKDVKMHLCGQTKAKDANVRQALIDRCGPGKDKAIGTKKNPGPLYGISGDVWAALAVGVTWWDTKGKA